MDARVDPIFAPLLNRVLEERPRDVLAFALRELDERRTREGPHPLVISGPSGVGKGALIRKLLDKYPAHFGFSVSHTTRPARAGEREGERARLRRVGRGLVGDEAEARALLPRPSGEHYHFVDRDAIARGIAEGRFVEHAEVHGEAYGTSLAAVDAVRADGRVCLLDIDVQGVQQVKRTALCPRFVFVAPPSMPVLEERLRARGDDDESKILEQLESAHDELEFGRAVGNFDRVIVNDDLETAFAELDAAALGWYPQLRAGARP